MKYTITEFMSDVVKTQIETIDSIFKFTSDCINTMASFIK